MYVILCIYSRLSRSNDSNTWSTESLGGEGAVLAVANALQLQALGVEHSQKRARQARTLDGPDALRKVGGWKMWCHVVNVVDLFFFSTCGTYFF